MSDINNLVITGRLTKDAVRKTFGTGGSAFAEFDVANNVGFGDYAKVGYFKCMLVGEKRAEGLLPYLTKGQLVGLAGELEPNNWTDKEGHTRYDWKFKINNIVLLGSKKESASNKGTGQGKLFDDSLDKQLKADAQKRYQNHGKSNFNDEDIPY